MFFLLFTFLIVDLYAFLMIYYRRAWMQMPEQDIIINDQLLPFISVVIAARNEEKNIGKCLDALAAQNYPAEKFEVIVVNDHSEDDTENIVRTYSTKFTNLKVIDLSKVLNGNTLNAYKKKAIEAAVLQSKGGLIMTTDADCVAPQSWIATVASYYVQSEFSMLAAPVKFVSGTVDGSFKDLFSIFQTLDFMSLQGITGAAIYKQFHYMANGANLVYSKKLFFELDGFSGVDTLASGDDMFLMEKVRTYDPGKIKYLKNKNVIVSTRPEKTISSFIQQRIRWASKSAAYQHSRLKQVLATVYVLNLWLVILAIACLFSPGLWYLLAVALAVKITVELLFLFPVSRFFGQSQLLWWFIPAQPFHIIYTVAAGFFGLFGKYRWKGRSVK